METTPVHEVEIAKWDALAGGPVTDEHLRVAHPDFGAFTRQDSTMLGIDEFIGDLRDKEVLELGNGMGEMTTLLARSGARVTAVDISPASTAVARRRAQLHGVVDSIEFVVAAGEELPLDSDRFDVVVGKAVLHHLDVTRAAPQLHRVLRPGGRAAFAEPLGTNPVVAFARDHLPYPGKNPRGADIPLSYADLAAWERPFTHGRASRGATARDGGAGVRRAFAAALRRADDWLLGRFPARDCAVTSSSRWSNEGGEPSVWLQSIAACSTSTFRSFSNAFARRSIAVGHALVDHPLFTLDAIGRARRSAAARLVRRERGNLPLVNREGYVDVGDGPPSATIRDIERNGFRVSLRDIQQDPSTPTLIDECLDEVEADPQGPRGRDAAPHRLPLHHGARRQHADALRPRAQLPAPGPGRRSTLALPPSTDDSIRPARARSLLRRRGVRLRGDGARSPRTSGSMPGVGVYLPSFVPHWVTTEAGISVSFSIPFYTRVQRTGGVRQPDQQAAAQDAPRAARARRVGARRPRQGDELRVVGEAARGAAQAASLSGGTRWRHEPSRGRGPRRIGQASGLSAVTGSSWRLTLTTARTSRRPTGSWRGGRPSPADLALRWRRGARTSGRLEALGGAEPRSRAAAPAASGRGSGPRQRGQRGRRRRPLRLARAARKRRDGRCLALGSDRRTRRCSCAARTRTGPRRSCHAAPGSSRRRPVRGCAAAAGRGRWALALLRPPAAAVHASARQRGGDLRLGAAGPGRRAAADRAIRAARPGRAGRAGGSFGIDQLPFHSRLAEAAGPRRGPAAVVARRGESIAGVLLACGGATRSPPTSRAGIGATRATVWATC